MKSYQLAMDLTGETMISSSPVDSPANHTVQQANDLGKLTSDISGRRCLESFLRLSQPTSWAKMFMVSLIGMGEWSSKKCVLNWRIVGTQYNRYYCQLRASVRHTTECEFGLLPTPTAMMDEAPIEKVDARNQKQMQKGNSPFILGLGQQAMRGMLPTPTVMDSSKDGDMTAAAKMMKGATHRSSGQKIQKTLTDAVQMEYLKSNSQIAEELANKPMLKRTKLPAQEKFVEWMRQTTPKKLSEITNLPLTKVEHWFRKDTKGFSHPQKEDWNVIKHHLENWQQWDYQLTYQESIEWNGMLPTPTAMNRNPTQEQTEKRHQIYGGKTRGMYLENFAVMGMLPTPTAQIIKHSHKKDYWDKRIVSKRQEDLTMVIHGYNGMNSQLNPRFVAEMMGFPPNWTELPFQNGDNSQ